MTKKRPMLEGIVAKLRQVDVMTSQGRTLGEAGRQVRRPMSAVNR